MRRVRIKGAWRSAKGRQSRKLALAVRMKADKVDKADKTGKSREAACRSRKE